MIELKQIERFLSNDRILYKVNNNEERVTLLHALWQFKSNITWCTGELVCDHYKEKGIVNDNRYPIYVGYLYTTVGVTGAKMPGVYYTNTPGYREDVIELDYRDKDELLSWIGGSNV